MLSYENESFKGVSDIMEKLNSMPTMQQKIDTFDAQPTTGDGILCMISGQLVIEGQENSLKFAQVFTLMPGGSAGYYCKSF